MWLLGFLIAMPLAAQVKTGLDVLAEQDFTVLKGKRAGVVANQNSLTSDRRGIVDVMTKSRNVRLVAIFAPEHGFTASQQAGADVQAGKLPGSGIPIRSLYSGGSSHPSPEMLAGLDVLLYDLPESGARFWTFTTTVAYMLEAAAARKIPIYVLDRPNPVNGVAVQGPLLEEKYFSMIGYGRRPVRHGMTMGELAQFFNAENHIGADLHVVKMEGWERRMWFDETGLEWMNPSPNLRSLTAVTLYPGTCLVENMAVSVGRGTDTPFQMFGAPWLKNVEIARWLNGRNVPGVRFLARRFFTTEQPYKGQDLPAIEVQLLNRDSLDAPAMGMELLAALLKFHPREFTLDRKIMLLLGSDKAAQMLRSGATGVAVAEELQEELKAFGKIRAKYLLY
jgi:uncharacterized protein YbbC (DUF1343 family)